MHICIATRIKPGFSRHGQPKASISKAKRKDIVAQAHVVHVGRFEQREINRLGITRIYWFEVENFAEFDGPNALEAAKKFAVLMAKGAAKNGPRCVADGPPPPPPNPWGKIEPRELIILNPRTGAPTTSTKAKT